MIASAIAGVKPALRLRIHELSVTREDLERKFDAAYWGGREPTPHDLHVNQCDYTHRLNEYLRECGVEDKP